MVDEQVSVNENAVEVSSIKFIECKFTVESRECLGGDWERNIGGANKEKRITFEGFATTALYDALIDAIGEVVE